MTATYTFDVFSSLDDYALAERQLDRLTGASKAPNSLDPAACRVTTWSSGWVFLGATTYRV